MTRDPDNAGYDGQHPPEDVDMVNASKKVVADRDDDGFGDPASGDTPDDASGEKGGGMAGQADHRGPSSPHDNAGKGNDGDGDGGEKDDGMAASGEKGGGMVGGGQPADPRRPSSPHDDAGEGNDGDGDQGEKDNGMEGRGHAQDNEGSKGVRSSTSPDDPGEEDDRNAVAEQLG
jgi:hypothetical protein